MREIIRTGILGGVAFAALTLGMARDADACTQPPPPEEDDCGILTEADTTYYAKLLSTVATPASPSQNCGCAAAASLSTGTVVGGVLTDVNGAALKAFCGEGSNEATTDAFNAAQLGGATWSPNAVLSAVAAGGVPQGVPVYQILKAQTPGGVFDGLLGVAKVNFVNGTVVVDPDHQSVTALDPDKCVKCDRFPNAQVCRAIAAARPQLDVTTLVARTACAKTDAVPLLGLSTGESDQVSPGCSTSRGRGPAGALMFGLVGLALAIARARRRA
jgi:hypothetical protein